MKRLGKTTRPGTWKVVQTLIIRAWTTCFKYWKIVFFYVINDIFLLVLFQNWIPHYACNHNNSHALSVDHRSSLVERIMPSHAFIQSSDSSILHWLTRKLQ